MFIFTCSGESPVGTSVGKTVAGGGLSLVALTIGVGADAQKFLGS